MKYYIAGLIIFSVLADTGICGDRIDPSSQLQGRGY